MILLPMSRHFRRYDFSWCRLAVLLTSLLGVAQIASAQPANCDPGKVMTATACAKCHAAEIATWQATPHYKTFQELSRNPDALEICNKLGIRSVKRSSLCVQCHFTRQNRNGIAKPVSGISCESCHGAARDWIDVHNDYGGPDKTKLTETAEHFRQRMSLAEQAGMANTRNLYAIARNCFQCHAVANEDLVNIGGHRTGNPGFELVAWSQGSIRHNFLRSGNGSNAVPDRNRLRLMYVVGLVADLEMSTRATAAATRRSVYGLQVANRAARTAVKLFELQQELRLPEVQKTLEHFAGAELRINNSEQLIGISDQILAAGNKLATAYDGSQMSAVDRYLPSPASYK